MIIYALYYYDRPLLEAWLNHYCNLPCIDEIIIQNQNWSQEDTLYLLDIVAKYIDYHYVKITIFPSQFQRVEGNDKRGQFRKYGQPRIRNRVMRFLKDKTWIQGSMDAAIYDGVSYDSTNKKLFEFEQLAKKRATEGKNTLGYLQVFTVCKDGVWATEYCTSKISPSFKNRMSRYADFPFTYTGYLVHDETMHIFRDGKMLEVGHPSGYHRKGVLKDPCFYVPLRIYHYQPLIRPDSNSVEFIPIKADDVPQKETQPRRYLEKLVFK